MADSAENEDRDVKGCCPQVFVVDSQAPGVPTPRQVAMKLDVHCISLVYLLLGVTLLGICIEAGFIYHLYSRLMVSSEIHKAEYIKGEKDQPLSTYHDNNDIVLGKNPQAVSNPAAFLQKGHGGFRWTSDVFPTFVRGLELKNNSLHIEQEGFYYIFSKISYLQNCSFLKHQVMCCTGRYSFKPMPLMQNSRYLCNSNKSQVMLQRSSSYLGGIFHLNKGDSVYVQINNPSQVYGEPSENFFGAFKIH